MALQKKSGKALPGGKKKKKKIHRRHHPSELLSLKASVVQSEGENQKHSVGAISACPSEVLDYFKNFGTRENFFNIRTEKARAL